MNAISGKLLTSNIKIVDLPCRSFDKYYFEEIYDKTSENKYVS